MYGAMQTCMSNLHGANLHVTTPYTAQGVKGCNRNRYGDGPLLRSLFEPTFEKISGVISFNFISFKPFRAGTRYDGYSGRGDQRLHG